MSQHELYNLLDPKLRGVIENGRCACGKEFNAGCKVCQRVLCKEHTETACPGPRPTTRDAVVDAALAALHERCKEFDIPFRGCFYRRLRQDLLALKGR